MHDQRIMHRDLKPANIFLTLKGRVSACGPFSHEEEAEVLLFASMERARDRRPTTEGTDAQKWALLSAQDENLVCTVPNKGGAATATTAGGTETEIGKYMESLLFFTPSITVNMDADRSDTPSPTWDLKRADEAASKQSKASMSKNAVSRRND